MANDDSKLVKLTSSPSEFIAATIAGALNELGIDAVADGGFTSGFKAEAPGWVYVRVAQEDLAQAKEALTNLKADVKEIDWSQVDVGEPEPDA